eukprot:11886412-Alexandrium_andersonii.AAC.1
MSAASGRPRGDDQLVLANLGVCCLNWLALGRVDHLQMESHGRPAPLAGQLEGGRTPPPRPRP